MYKVIPSAWLCPPKAPTRARGAVVTKRNKTTHGDQPTKPVPSPMLSSRVCVIGCPTRTNLPLGNWKTCPKHDTRTFLMRRCEINEMGEKMNPCPYPCRCRCRGGMDTGTRTRTRDAQIGLPYPLTPDLFVFCDRLAHGFDQPFSACLLP